MNGWIGVDLDGTLAHYEGWQGVDHVGLPVPAMLARVLAWIFTARVSAPADCEEGVAALTAINAWMDEHLGQRLRVTNEKDFGMVELWDDRAVQVEANTGRPVGYSTRGLA